MPEGERLQTFASRRIGSIRSVSYWTKWRPGSAERVPDGHGVAALKALLLIPRRRDDQAGPLPCPRCEAAWCSEESQFFCGSRTRLIHIRPPRSCHSASHLSGDKRSIFEGGRRYHLVRLPFPRGWWGEFKGGMNSDTKTTHHFSVSSCWRNARSP